MIMPKQPNPPSSTPARAIAPSDGPRMFIAAAVPGMGSGDMVSNWPTPRSCNTAVAATSASGVANSAATPYSSDDFSDIRLAPGLLMREQARFNDGGHRQVAQHQQQQHAEQADGADPRGHGPKAGRVEMLRRRQVVAVLRRNQHHEVVAPHAGHHQHADDEQHQGAAAHGAEPQQVDRQQGGSDDQPEAGG